MKLALDIGALERFEDEAGLGVFALLAAPEKWRIKTVRAFAAAAGNDPADIEAWLAADLMGAIAQTMDALTDALTPPEEAAENLPDGDGGGDTESANFPLGVGLSSSE